MKRIAIKFKNPVSWEDAKAIIPLSAGVTVYVTAGGSDKILGVEILPRDEKKVRGFLVAANLI